MRIQIFYHQNYFNCTVIDKISPNSLPIAVGEWNLNLHFNDNYIHLHFLHRVMINWKIKQFLTEYLIISCGCRKPVQRHLKYILYFLIVSR